MAVQENHSNLTTCWVLEKNLPASSKVTYSCPFTGCAVEWYENFLYSPATEYLG
jgi:hypothetical protein